MSSRPLLALLFLLVGWVSQTLAHPTIQRPLPGEGKPLRILSWNIFMLPPMIHPKGKRTRAAVIAEELRSSDYQVLVFQEAFLSDARRIIRRSLDGIFPFEYGPANNDGGFGTSSGIWVLSKVPLKPLEDIRYSKCKGIPDCFARKGAMLLEGEHDGHRFQILGTHLQSVGPQNIRQSQYEEMRALLDRHRVDGVPQIVCGDMNTSKHNEQDYHAMLTSLDVEDGPMDLQLEGQGNTFPNDLRTWGNGELEVIDYVFYRPNQKAAKRMTRTMRSIRKPWCKRHRDLSDHFAMDFAVWWD